MNDIALDTIDELAVLPEDATPATAPEGTEAIFVQDEAYSEDEVR